MRTIIIFCTMILTGCASLDTCVPVEKEVYKYPEFSMPQRPTLQDPPAIASEGLVIRIMETNMTDLMNYAEQLENTLNSVRKPK